MTVHRFHARGRRGFTMVEMAVALAVLGLLLLFTLPRVIGASDFANGEKAKATASGALDVITQLAQGVRLTNSLVPVDGQRCDDPPASGPRTQTSRDHGYTKAELLLIEEYKYVPPPLTPNFGYMTSPVTPTNCPAFVDPASLAEQTGDVKFVRGDQTSPDASTASVAAWGTQTGWRVAVAVLAPASSQALGSCWMVTRDFPATSGWQTQAQSASNPGKAAERYYVNATITQTTPAPCTANGAQVYEIDSLCKDLTGNTVTTPIGDSWRRPCATVLF